MEPLCGQLDSGTCISTFLWNLGTIKCGTWEPSWFYVWNLYVDPSLVEPFVEPLSGAFENLSVMYCGTFL